MIEHKMKECFAFIYDVVKYKRKYLCTYEIMDYKVLRKVRTSYQTKHKILLT